MRAIAEDVADGGLAGQLTGGTDGIRGGYETETDGRGVCDTDGVLDTGGVVGGVLGGMVGGVVGGVTGEVVVGGVVVGGVADGVPGGGSVGKGDGDEDTGTGSVGGVSSALARCGPIVSRAGTAINSSGSILAELAITAQPRSSGRVPVRGSHLQYARDQRA